MIDVSQKLSSIHASPTGSVTMANVLRAYLVKLFRAGRCTFMCLILYLNSAKDIPVLCGTSRVSITPKTLSLNY